MYASFGLQSWDDHKLDWDLKKDCVGKLRFNTPLHDPLLTVYILLIPRDDFLLFLALFEIITHIFCQNINKVNKEKRNPSIQYKAVTFLL